MNLGDVKYALITTTDGSIEEAVVTVRKADGTHVTQLTVVDQVIASGASGASGEHKKIVLEAICETLCVSCYTIPSLLVPIKGPPSNARPKLQGCRQHSVA